MIISVLHIWVMSSAQYQTENGLAQPEFELDWQDTESENEFGAPGVNLERQQKSKTNASLKTVVGDEGRGGEGNGGRSESDEESEEDDDDDDDVAAPPIEGESMKEQEKFGILRTRNASFFSKAPTTRPSTRT